jgi:hypothetical protein
MAGDARLLRREGDQRLANPIRECFDDLRIVRAPAGGRLRAQP